MLLVGVGFVVGWLLLLIFLKIGFFFRFICNQIVKIIMIMFVRNGICYFYVSSFFLLRMKNIKVQIVVVFKVLQLVFIVINEEIILCLFFGVYFVSIVLVLEIFVFVFNF